MKVQFLDAATRQAVKNEVVGNFTEVSNEFNLFMAAAAAASPGVTFRDAMPSPGLIVRTMSDGHEVRIYTDMYVEPGETS